MRSSTFVPAALITLILPVATLGACGDAAVVMDQQQMRSGPAGTVRGSGTARYQDAATGAVGTPAAPAPVTNDGREGPDTVYSPEATPPTGDTIR